MHFDLTVTLGNLVTLLGLFAMLLRIERVLSKYVVEHEILIRDYCERHKIEPADLPTRGDR